MEKFRIVERAPGVYGVESTARVSKVYFIKVEAENVEEAKKILLNCGWKKEDFVQ